MAISDHIRARKRSFPRSSPSSKERPARRLPRADQSKNPRAPAIVSDVRLCIARMRRFRAVLLTVVAALHQQNADLDADIASTLQHAVSDPLDAEIERLEAVLKAAGEVVC